MDTELRNFYGVGWTVRVLGKSDVRRRARNVVETAPVGACCSGVATACSVRSARELCVDSAMNLGSGDRGSLATAVTAAENVSRAMVRRIIAGDRWLNWVLPERARSWNRDSRSNCCRPPRETGRRAARLRHGFLVACRRAGWRRDWDLRWGSCVTRSVLPDRSCWRLSGRIDREGRRGVCSRGRYAWVRLE